jgi:putative membrane protein
MEDNQNEASKFMVKAANGGMMEVELGSLAKDKATNPQVKEFAAMMVTDHSKANEELKSLAGTKNFTLPATMDSDHRDHITELSNKTGNDFDKAYMDMMVNDHKKDIDLFEDITKKENVDADLKAFATKTLPTLKKHHEAAKRIQDALK